MDPPGPITAANRSRDAVRAGRSAAAHSAEGAVLPKVQPHVFGVPVACATPAAAPTAANMAIIYRSVSRTFMLDPFLDAISLRSRWRACARTLLAVACAPRHANTTHNPRFTCTFDVRSSGSATCRRRAARVHDRHQGDRVASLRFVSHVNFPQRYRELHRPQTGEAESGEADSG